MISPMFSPSKELFFIVHLLLLLFSSMIPRKYTTPSSTTFIKSKLIVHYPLSEIVGKPFQALCHPADVVHVMKELKEAGGSSQPTISLLYRLRRKYSGYVWIESVGKLHGVFYLQLHLFPHHSIYSSIVLVSNS